VSLKVFITGISGLLGSTLALRAREQSCVTGAYLTHPIHPEGVETLRVDVRSAASVRETLTRIRPDVVVHTAGLTNVEACETDRELARQLNVTATREVACAARGIGARLVHISTDHLFNGTRAWWTEVDRPGPVNVYAGTKWEAEQAVLEECPDALIIRTNFYGWGTPTRKSFSDWVLESLQAGQPLTMFHDVFFTPIITNDLADLILALLACGATGVFHVAGKERVSKYEFAVRLAEVFDMPVADIRAVSVAGFPFKAARPRDMSLSSQKVEGVLEVRMPGLLHGLERLRKLWEAGWPRSLQATFQDVAPPIGSQSAR